MVLSYPALAGEGVMDRGQRAKARRYRISITPLPTLDVPFFFFWYDSFLEGTSEDREPGGNPTTTKINRAWTQKLSQNLQNLYRTKLEFNWFVSLGSKMSKGDCKFKLVGGVVVARLDLQM
jgi:hypothetical protein